MRALVLVLPISLALSTGGSCGHAAAPEEAAAEVAVGDAGAPDTAEAADAGEDAGADAAERAADAGDDAGDGGAVDAGPPLPSFADEPFPAKGTPFPKAAEWASAPLVAIDRALPAALFAAHAAHAGAAQCTARRLHEWVRVHCARLNGGAVLLGGNRDGLSIFFDKAGGGTAVIFPVRRGDRRVLEVLGSETVSFKAFSSERATFAFVLSEQWPAGDERPTIVAE
jgi:hypothetical protein